MTAAALRFSVTGATPRDASATPGVDLALRVQSDAEVASALVRCEVRIEPARRTYAPEETPRLHDVFGEPARWARSLRPLLWAQPTVMLPAFQGETVVALPLPCDLDLDGATAKYLEALESGDIHLSFLFSGTVFHAREGGGLRVAPVPWTSEARFALPLAVYRAAYELHYPDRTVLAVPRAVLERLGRYKVARGAATWGQAIEALLAEASA